VRSWDGTAGRRGTLGACLALLAAWLGSGCATQGGPPPLEALDRRIDLERFMGDWYVVGFIPITLPFFGEAGAHNAVESYRLRDDGVIETTYTFRDGGFDGPERRLTPKGRVHDTETNAEWRMQFVWPFEAAYLIVYVDDGYRRSIVGVPDRDHVWLLSRDAELSEAEYAALVAEAARLGHDPAAIRRVPQRWPDG